MGITRANTTGSLLLMPGTHSKKTQQKLTSTIEVVDKSGKVISSSKSILSAFKDAQKAYKARKAEILAERQQRKREKDAERLEREAIRLARIEKEERRQKRREKRERKEKEKQERLARGEKLEDIEREEALRRARKEEKKRRKREREALGIYDDDNESVLSIDTVSTSLSQEDERLRGLDPNSPEYDMMVARYPPTNIDFDLDADTPLTRMLTQLTFMLENMSCMHQSVSVLIQTLQKDPDSLAVVGLSLAEIAAVVSKAGPSVLAAAKASFPVIFSLLSSPHFLVLAGAAGIGTVVVLGGYKIYRKIIGADGQPAAEEDFKPIQLMDNTGDEPKGYADLYEESARKYDEMLRKQKELEAATSPKLLMDAPSKGNEQRSDKKDKEHRKGREEKKDKDKRRDRSRSRETTFSSFRLSRRHTYAPSSTDSKDSRRHKDKHDKDKDSKKSKKDEAERLEKKLARERERQIELEIERKRDEEWELEQQRLQEEFLNRDQVQLEGVKGALKRFFTEK